MTESELIARIKERAAGDPSLIIGIGDDAAVIRPAAGMDLVATTDTLVEGVHFDSRFTPADIGHLALASNLSDLAAMGAEPRWVLLSLILPEGDASWVEGFLDGFLPLAAGHRVVLAGGNLARGPLNVTVQALGEAVPGKAATRRGALPGDLLAITGTIGDAAAALALGEDAAEALKLRLTRPVPRVAAGRALAGRAHAMTDLSDGLLADLAKLVHPSCGARVELSALPASATISDAVARTDDRWKLQLGGGSDYELLAALPPECERDLDALARTSGVALTAIGAVEDGGEIRCVTPDGGEWQQPVGAWEHFSAR